MDAVYPHSSRRRRVIVNTIREIADECGIGQNAMVPMPHDNSGEGLETLITRFFRDLGGSLVDGDRFEVPSADPKRLGKLLDSSFSDPEVIGRVVDLLLEIRAKLPGWPGPAASECTLDAETAASICRFGFAETYRRAQAADRERIGFIYQRMLVDEGLLLDAQEAIMAEETSPFWSARIFQPDVRVIDLANGAPAESGRRGPDHPKIKYALRIEGDALVAMFSGMNGNAGRRAQYALRPADDPTIAAFDRPKARRAGTRPRIDSRMWSKVFGPPGKADPQRGEATVTEGGELECRIAGRPDDAEMMGSVLLVALMGQGRH